MSTNGPFPLPVRAPMRRPNFEALRIYENQDMDNYSCDCGFNTSNQEMFDRHQRTDCPNFKIRCSFCSELFPTNKALGEHLIHCGNKTDQCPNCYKLIRRAHFTYHYENNCASIDEMETPPQIPKSNLNPTRIVNNSQQPIGRQDIQPTSVSNNNRTRLSLAGSGQNSPLLMECGSCHQKFSQTDFDRHRNVCQANQSRQISPVTTIPCEFCQKSIESPNYRSHVEFCRQSDQKRIFERAKSIEREPVLELLPCEHCDKSFPGEQLQQHQKFCPMNRAAQGNPRPPQRSEFAERAQYQTIDREGTRQANGIQPVRRRRSMEQMSDFNDDRSPKPAARGEIHPYANDRNGRRSNPDDYEPFHQNDRRGIVARRENYRQELIGDRRPEMRQQTKQSFWKRMCCGSKNTGADDNA